MKTRHAPHRPCDSHILPSTTNSSNIVYIMSSHTIDLHLFRPTATTSATPSTTNLSKPPNHSAASEDMMGLDSAKIPSPPNKIPTSSDNNPRASILSEKSQYRPPSEIHPAFSSQENPSVDTLPSYTPHEEQVSESQSAQAKTKGPMLEKALKIEADREASKGYSGGGGGHFTGIGGIGNYAKGHLK